MIIHVLQAFPNAWWGATGMITVLLIPVVAIPVTIVSAIVRHTHRKVD